jgi:hypothetical protein
VALPANNQDISMNGNIGDLRSFIGSTPLSGLTPRLHWDRRVEAVIRRKLATMGVTGTAVRAADGTTATCISQV